MIWVLARDVYCDYHGPSPCLAHATTNDKDLIKFKSKMEAEQYVETVLNNDPDILIIPEMEVIRPNF